MQLTEGVVVNAGALLFLLAVLALMWNSTTSSFLRRAFHFDGTISHLKFCALYALWSFLALAVFIAAAVVGQMTNAAWLSGTIAGVGLLVTEVELLAIDVRRIRDIGWPIGKTLLLLAAPVPVLGLGVVGLVSLMFLAFMPGQLGLGPQATDGSARMPYIHPRLHPHP